MYMILMSLKNNLHFKENNTLHFWSKQKYLASEVVLQLFATHQTPNTSKDTECLNGFLKLFFMFLLYCS